MSELEWAAGFFDGEGWVGFIVNPQWRNYGSLKIGINQAADRFVLDRFLAAVGAGKIAGPYIDPRPESLNRRPTYQFRAGAVKEVTQIMELIAPFLSPVKKSQWDTALAAYNESRKTFVPGKSGPIKGSHHQNPRRRKV